MHTRTPLHAASSHLRTTASPQCYCFSLCSTSEIPPFRASIPQLVTSTLDSVQFQMNKMRHGAELVLTRRACMGFQEGAVEPVRTCPPTACTELRTGWKASWACHCNDNASALLNCAG